MGNPYSSQDNKNTQKRKLPEFINLEKETPLQQKAFPPLSFSKESLPKIPLPFPYRVLCLLGSVIAAFWTLGGLVIQTIFALGYALTLFQSKFMKILVLDCWERVCKGTVVSLSLLFAFFSPQFALIVFLSYFTLKGSTWQEDFLGKILRKYLQK